jgi:hypothetical protein
MTIESPLLQTPAAVAAISTPTSPARAPWKYRPLMAALLAWLIPGAGHFYQGRVAKGMLFSFCILGTFLYGIMLCNSRVVYASFRPGDLRPSFICQAGAGLVTFPAIVQLWRVKNVQAPLWNNFMAPPVIIGQRVPLDWLNEQFKLGVEETGLKHDNHQFQFYNDSAVMIAWDGDKPPDNPLLNETKYNQLSFWQSKYDFKYEMGWLFTAVAGLLNLLVVIDAAAGPAFGYDQAEWHKKVVAHEQALHAERAAAIEAKKKKTVTPPIENKPLVNTTTENKPATTAPTNGAQS